MHALFSRILLLMAGVAFVWVAVGDVPTSSRLPFALLGLAVSTGIAVQAVHWLLQLQDDRVMERQVHAVLADGSATLPSARRAHVAIGLMVLGVGLVLGGSLCPLLVVDANSTILALATVSAGLSVFAVGSGYLSDIAMLATLGAMRDAMRKDASDHETNGE